MRQLFKYLKEAFWVRQHVPLLGDLPVNALAVLGFVALGFGNPAFWLLGALGEVGFLWALAGNDRFRKLVDAKEVVDSKKEASELREELIEQLSPKLRERYERVLFKLNKVESYYQDFAEGDPVASRNLESLGKLDWCHLKLLIAKLHYESDENGAEEDITRIIGKLERELQRKNLTPAARASKEATLEISRKRLATYERREQSLEEIESDLARIEAQFDLAVENATMRAKPADVELDLELASSQIGTGDYLQFGGTYGDYPVLEQETE